MHQVFGWEGREQGNTSGKIQRVECLGNTNRAEGEIWAELKGNKTMSYHKVKNKENKRLVKKRRPQNIKKGQI